MNHTVKICLRDHISFPVLSLLTTIHFFRDAAFCCRFLKSLTCSLHVLLVFPCSSSAMTVQMLCCVQWELIPQKSCQPSHLSFYGFFVCLFERDVYLVFKCGFALVFYPQQTLVWFNCFVNIYAPTHGSSILLYSRDDWKHASPHDLQMHNDSSLHLLRRSMSVAEMTDMKC